MTIFTGHGAGNSFDVDFPWELNNTGEALYAPLRCPSF